MPELALSVAEALQHPGAQYVLLAEVVLGEYLPFWEDNGDGTHTAVSAHRVVGLRIDGAGLTGGWSWDSATGEITVTEATIGADPREATMQALVALYVANVRKVFDGIPYEPRLRLAGNQEISESIPARFGERGRIGMAALHLDNSDGAMDALADLDWAAGWVALRLGVDL